MTTLKQGDLIKDCEEVRKVLGVCGDVLHISRGNSHDAHHFTATEFELKTYGYTWYTPAWEIKKDEMYWFIGADADVRHADWMNDTYDHDRRDFLGIYQTKELCEAALLEIRRKLGK